MNADTPHPSDPAQVDPADPAVVGRGGAAPAGQPASGRSERLLEARLKRMENYLGFRPLTETEAEGILNGLPPPAGAVKAVAADEGLEMEIGEYWLARVGVLALSVGLAFLVAYPFAGLPALASCLIGYAAAASFFAMSHRWRQGLPDTSHILFGGALFLLYFATLRLHFFSAHPVLPNRGAGLAMMVLVLAVEFVLTARRPSELMTVLVLGLSLVTGLISDHAVFQLGLLVVLAAATYGLVRLRGWPWFSLVATGLPYFMHLDWLLGHPLLGRGFHGVGAAQGNLLALAAYTVPLAAIGFRPKAEEDHVVLRIGRALVISGATMLVALVNVRLFSATQPPWTETVAASGFLVLAYA
ncbi:MAG: hypothetical protein HYV75_05335, partial [Opitutae bacterium]|nr:hypothetical protein [Opitutae bacterium]